MLCSPPLTQEWVWRGPGELEPRDTSAGMALAAGCVAPYWVHIHSLSAEPWESHSTASSSADESTDNSH